jgi:uncharacterized protein YjbJ (UPF0337 family)
MHAQHAGKEPANPIEEQDMSVNKDQVKGRAEEAKGKVKEVAGKVFGDKAMQVKGNIQKNLGAVHAAVGDAKANFDKSMKQT